VRACLWSTEPVPLIARTALLSVAVFVWSACPASLRTHINPLSTIALTEHNPTLRVSLVELIGLERAGARCYANHSSAAVLRSELNQLQFRTASPDSARPAVFEDQTTCRLPGILSRQPHAISRICRLVFAFHPISTSKSNTKHHILE
jgi:hypothetical protein